MKKEVMPPLKRFGLRCLLSTTLAVIVGYALKGIDGPPWLVLFVALIIVAGVYTATSGKPVV